MPILVSEYLEDKASYQTSTLNFFEFSGYTNNKRILFYVKNGPVFIFWLRDERTKA